MTIYEGFLEKNSRNLPGVHNDLGRLFILYLYLSKYFGLDSCTDFDCLNGLAYDCNFYRFLQIG